MAEGVAEPVRVAVLDPGLPAKRSHHLADGGGGERSLASEEYNPLLGTGPLREDSISLRTPVLDSRALHVVEIPMEDLADRFVDGDCAGLQALYTAHGDGASARTRGHCVNREICNLSEPEARKPPEGEDGERAGVLGRSPFASWWSR